MSILLPPPSFFASLPWFHPYFDIRERFERHLNPTFNGPKHVNRSDQFNRIRLGAKFDLAPKFWATVEYQNATDQFWTGAGNGMTHNSDASLAFLEYSTKKVIASLGREKIALGEMRLIGPTEWTDLSRSFDVARIQAGTWDAWAGTLGMATKDTKTTRIADLTHIDRRWGTTSIILKHDAAPLASVDEQTLDHFVRVRVRKTTVDGEAAIQTGSANLKDQRAWAYHARVAQEVLPRTTLSLEVDSASGGNNGTTSRTFDNLYPSNHGLYGLADSTGWKNMNYVATRLEYKPSQLVTLRVTEQTFALRDPSDAWYGYSGAPNVKSGGVFQDPTGKSGRQLGRELDLEAICSLKKLGEISLGVALFNPGDFVKAITRRSDSLTYGYIQYTAKF